MAETAPFVVERSSGSGRGWALSVATTILAARGRVVVQDDCSAPAVASCPGMKFGRVQLPFLHSAEEARAMYAGGRANLTARRTRVSGLRCSAGCRGGGWCSRSRGATRVRRAASRSVRLVWTAITSWSRCSARAATGCVTSKLPRGSSPSGTAASSRRDLSRSPVEQRARVLKRYVEQVPGARPHIPVDRTEDIRAFEAIAASYPVFRIVARSSAIPPQA
jgi:hypothetical protein